MSLFKLRSFCLWFDFFKKYFRGSFTWPFFFDAKHVFLITFYFLFIFYALLIRVETVRSVKNEPLLTISAKSYYYLVLFIIVIFY